MLMLVYIYPNEVLHVFG